MTNSWIQRWDERHSNEEFVYGQEPNNYLKDNLSHACKCTQKVLTKKIISQKNSI
jgi:hypothetical protein